jgi:hypothetical protein
MQQKIYGVLYGLLKIKVSECIASKELLSNDSLKAKLVALYGCETWSITIEGVWEHGAEEDICS